MADDIRLFGKDGALSLCHINITSLSYERFLALETTISGVFDIITLSETSLHPNKDVPFDLHLPGYHPIIRRDRVDRIRGGVAAYIKLSLIVNRRNDLESAEIEQLCLDVRLSNKKITIFVVYRPPGNPVEFWEHLQTSVDKLVENGATDNSLIITGDLNADPKTYNGSLLTHFCNTNSFTIHVKEPTRITTDSATILDQFISNLPSIVKNVQVFPPLADNDHCTVAISVTFTSIPRYTYRRHVWNCDLADVAGLNSAILHYDWHSCFDSDNVDDVCSAWTSAYLSLAKQFIPNVQWSYGPMMCLGITVGLGASKERKIDFIEKLSNQRGQIYGTDLEKCAINI